jgi:hypothetical protein
MFDHHSTATIAFPRPASAFPVASPIFSHGSHRLITFRNPVFPVQVSFGFCLLEYNSALETCSTDSYYLRDLGDEVVVVVVVVVVVAVWDSDARSANPDSTSR